MIQIKKKLQINGLCFYFEHIFSSFFSGWLLYSIQNRNRSGLMSRQSFQNETVIIFENQRYNFIRNKITFRALRCVHIGCWTKNNIPLPFTVGRFSLETLQITRRFIFRVGCDDNWTIHIWCYFYRFSPCIKTIQTINMMKTRIEKTDCNGEWKKREEKIIQCQMLSVFLWVVFF